MTEAGEDDVMFEGVLEAAPEKVWRALTVPELLGAWLLPAREAAAGLELDGTEEGLPRIDCEVIEAEAPSLLRYRWQANGEVESVVTFELTRIAEGTWLRLTHEPAPARVMAAANNNGPVMLAA
ncbi:SRPBCC domain-containing protein [Devosia sp. D6-9]|nr:SRPBCC domain-containing protein [Devosia sp. D6-9]